MKYKFWAIYLAITVLFTGIGYFALGNVSDIPLALSESEMDVLRGTSPGSNRKCLASNEEGCTDSKCGQVPIGQVKTGIDSMSVGQRIIGSVIIGDLSMPKFIVQLFSIKRIV